MLKDRGRESTSLSLRLRVRELDHEAKNPLAPGNSNILQHQSWGSVLTTYLPLLTGLPVKKKKQKMLCEVLSPLVGWSHCLIHGGNNHHHEQSQQWHHHHQGAEADRRFPWTEDRDCVRTELSLWRSFLIVTGLSSTATVKWRTGFLEKVLPIQINSNTG